MTESKIEEFEWVRTIATADLRAEGGVDGINAAFAKLCEKHTQAVALTLICQIVHHEARLALVADAITATMAVAGPDDPQEQSPLH